ncbi:MAG: DUF2124 domain-containing protein [Candidatus Methanospirare jalkutatii]|nr:MAG: DUF2124 domain-containing protein [Candidatus Methanospirare jalkutatii]UYZ40789.1 MAG: DUF2124 domain-containing protein [Candidatus Methanospirare jalkutatii]
MSEEKKTGIVGFTATFREVMADVPSGSKVVFAGSVAVCTPFIELLAYTVRDKNYEMLYVPRAEASEARKIKEVKNIGFCVVDEKGDPSNPAAIVILGGLAMPKFGVPPENVLNMIKEISGYDASAEKEAKEEAEAEKGKPKIIGVCFMNIFERANWLNKIKFDVITDTTMETVVK